MSLLSNRTRERDIRNGKPGECHIIYETQIPTGIWGDYCREDLPLVETYGAACAHAQALFDSKADQAAQRAVQAFRVEWW